MARIFEVRSIQRSNDLMTDIQIIGGFLTSSYVIMKAAPYVRPVTTAMFRYSELYWNHLKHRALLITGRIFEIRNTAHRSSRRKDGLVRWLGRNLPAFLFPPAPRICVLMQGVTYTSADEILRNIQIRPALSELEDFNDEGIIVAYAKTSDSESETMDPEPTDIVPDFGFVDTLPNTHFSMKFDPWTGGCSTPLTYASPVQNWLASSVDSAFPVEDTVTQEANALKIASLEMELAKMKTMFEMLLQNQATSLSLNLPALSPPRNVDTAYISKQPTKATPAPPPPPPPPPAPLIQPLPSQKIIKLKTKSELEAVSVVNSEVPQSTGGTVTLFDVLKGLSNVKLKPVERSPGGTPFKPKPIHSDKDLDPAAMIAAALKKRFARIQSLSPKRDHDEEESFSDKENNPEVNTSEDSFTRSPSFFQFGNSMRQKNSRMTDSPSSLKRTLLDHKLNSFPKKRKSTGGSPADTQIPLFGQHLLKRRISNSLQKKQSRLSLNEEGNSSN